MKIVITGSNGFIGNALVARILEQNGLGAGHPELTELCLVDLQLPEYTDPRVTRVVGSIADASVREAAAGGDPDVFYHMASLPGGASERNFEAGYAVNVDATFALFRLLAKQAVPVKLVFASTIAVFGVPLPDYLDDETLPMPGLSYGAQKLMGEMLLNDMSRRKMVDARSVRLSGILARPSGPSGLISAYLSDVIHAARKGEHYTVPVSKAAPTWVLSQTRCIDNLIHAARVPGEALPARRIWTFPALRLTIGEQVGAMAELLGPHVHDLISYKPVESIEKQFGNYPPLSTKLADSIGFTHDGDPISFMRRVFEALDAEEAKT
jgi:nucleoside-diphosphate-sugar epimerase